MKKNENPILSLACNIVIPVLILNKGHKYLGEFLSHVGIWTLILALLFPMIYGGFDLLKKNKWNWLSVLGIVNIVLTGGLALLQMTSIWFAIKEAVFPLLIGIFVCATLLTPTSFFEHLVSKAHFFKWSLIQEKIKEMSKEVEFKRLMQKCTLCFSLTFVISAALNFFLALYIFSKPVDVGAITEGQEQIALEEVDDIVLNHKISQDDMAGIYCHRPAIISFKCFFILVFFEKSYISYKINI